MFPDKIWFYISDRIETDNTFPGEDEIYEAFKDYFEIIGYKWEVAENEVRKYASISELNGIKIEWEGELGEAL